MSQLQVIRIAAAGVFSMGMTTIAVAPSTLVELLPYQAQIISLTPVQVLHLDTNMTRPAGITWQRLEPDGHDLLWVSDIDQQRVTSISPHSAVTEVDFQVGGADGLFRPGPLIIDPLASPPDPSSVMLWTIDHGSDSLIRGFTVGGPPASPTLSPSAGVPLVGLDRRSRITGLAIDPLGAGSPQFAGSDRVWTCRGGGLCSTIEIWDTTTGTVVDYFYPRCEPVDIAFDPSGSRLWILADNGPSRPYLLFERELTGDGDERVLSAGNLSKRTFRLPGTLRPISLTASDNAVWVLTGRQESASGRATGRTLIFKFDIGSPSP